MATFEGNSTAVLAGTTLVAFIFGGFFIWKEKRKFDDYEESKESKYKVPRRWRKVGEVDKILVYPLKAAKHLSLEKANCTKLGLEQENTTGVHLLDRYDYFFMVM